METTLSAVYPLPFLGITASGSFRSLYGYTVHLLAGVAHHALCRQLRRSLRPGELVIPGVTTATLNVPLRAPETEYMPRIDQLDLSLSKTITVRGVRVLPKVDVVNVTNSDRWSSITTAQFGTAAYLQPATILQGRLIRLAIEMSW